MDLGLLLLRVKTELTVEYGKLYLTYYHGRYTIYLNKRCVLQTNPLVYNLFNKQAAKIAMEALAILMPEAKVVYPHIMIGDSVL